MNHLQKLKSPSLLKWVSLISPQNYVKPSKFPLLHYIGPFYTAKTPTFYSSVAESTEKIKKEAPNSLNVVNKPRFFRAQARAAFCDYLHGTRSLDFADAEYISKHSPIFLDKLLGKVEIEQDIGQSLRRFFRYHPINEFEPFFESVGLKPSEFDTLLPREMFLDDDELLLENYHVLCNCGIRRGKIGRIYKEAMEVFRYDYGVLHLKLRAYEELGLSLSSVVKFVEACPSLLIGGVDGDFVKVLEVLESLGIGNNWIKGRLSEKNSYDWSRMLRLLDFICEMSYNKEELGASIKRHPEMLLDGSGTRAFSMIGFLRKVGCTEKEVSSLLMQLPQVQLGSFLKNLRNGLVFLMEIEMDAEDIGNIMRAHTIMLGSCSLKKPNSIFFYLNVGKKRLCEHIKEDPLQLKKWVLGQKVDPVPNLGEKDRSRKEKTKFLLNLGYVENSDEIKKAFKLFRGNGAELEDRFDCFVRAGLDPKDVAEMIKVSPQILNQSKDVLEKKIDYLVNGLGYPVSYLVTFPSYMAYTIDRVKRRFKMYEWLKKEGVVTPTLALSTVMTCTDKIFIKRFVRHHPRGLEIWEELKKKTHCPRE